MHAQTRPRHRRYGVTVYSCLAGIGFSVNALAALTQIGAIPAAAIEFFRALFSVRILRGDAQRSGQRERTDEQNGSCNDGNSERGRLPAHGAQQCSPA